MVNQKKLLLRQLKWTVLLLSTAMLAMWFLFYVNINRAIQNYVRSNMEQVAGQVNAKLEQSFLQIEEVSFELSKEEEVLSFLQSSGISEFYTKAGQVEILLNKLPKDTSFMDNIIMYNSREMFYRFCGNVSNTGVHRIMTIVKRDEVNQQICIKLDHVNYIGFVTSIIYNGIEQGTIIMLTDQKQIYQLFEQMTDNHNIGIALAADGEIIVSNLDTMIGQLTTDIVSESDYLVQSRVGFTPFEILVTYENADQRISIFFFVTMLVMALILLAILKLFISFWKEKFFNPIQTVISEVEHFDNGKGEVLCLTGLEHFDGLVNGINDLVERVEKKEREVYETTLNLQESELKQQKALIISLKKQISAHFTINVLNIIKVLAANGENEKAGLLCDGLSFLIRYANAGDSFISAMDEFFVLEKYVDIMEIRYPGKFTAEIDFEDELENLELPRMLIQPVIENSILHGLMDASYKGIGKIHVHSKLETKDCCFIVEDNGAGMDKNSLSHLLTQLDEASEGNTEVEGLSHVALVNIQRRIHSYFGNEYGLQIESDQVRGTKVTIRLPRRSRGL